RQRPRSGSLRGRYDWWARTVSNRRHLLCKFDRAAFVADPTGADNATPDRSALLLFAVVDVRRRCQRMGTGRRIKVTFSRPAPLHPRPYVLPNGGRRIRGNRQQHDGGDHAH
ncbi:hypothetical protein, partial [Streptomyces sp. NPDC057582]|uniref:hypothetical protein n=1 Tax=Streptomyces sp. NPDC057582 TaxID=3346174 RepID=UPI0036745831